MAERLPRRAAGRASEPETAFDDRQRRVFLMLIGAAAALVGVALIVPPSGALYWLALAAALIAAPALAYALGGAAARGMDSRLFLGRAAGVAWHPLPPAALTEPERAALLQAMLPGLLARLVQDADRLPERHRAAILGLREAACTAWDPRGNEAMRLLATELPVLMAAPQGRSEAAALAVERLAALVKAPGPETMVAWKAARATLIAEAAP